MTRTIRILIGAVTVLAVAGVAAGVAVGVDSPDRADDPRPDRRLPPATEPVERGDLRDTTQVDGTLGYAQERKLNAGTAGTVTWTARTGSRVRRDGRLYAVNGVGVRLMYGRVPMYRVLKPGDVGGDVHQVEENLSALGYTGFTVDDEYTDLTAAAVKRWQDDRDLPKTGTLGPEQIAFGSAPVRVKHVEAAVATLVAPGQPVLTTTRTQRVVTFALEVARTRSATKGTKVRVTLPGGHQVGGRVTAVGSTATTGSDADSSPKVTITVSFDRSARITDPDQSPVTVDLVGTTHKKVLSVPVGALLARPGGGFDVQVVENGAVRSVKVELGLFADGRVEVTGSGLREGMEVGVPKL